MKIAFIPIDNRPVCYNLAKDIAAIDEELQLFIPPREFLGDLKKTANVSGIFDWLKNLPETDCMVLSLDTLAYGGLIPSRRSKETFEEIKTRMLQLKPLLLNKKVYAFSSIMRISNNNYNEEEKEYWSEYGTKIFEYSYLFHKNGVKPLTEIPDTILQDYLETRKRNFEINKMYLDWQKEGIFDTLIFSKDDCAEYGFNVKEALDLEAIGGKTKTGADEIPLTLLARAIEKDIKIYPKFLEPDFKNCISNYEDVSIEKSVLGQLELGGFKLAETEEESDLVLVVNNFIEKQGELVMGWDTKPFSGEFIPPNKPYAIADVRFANGADNAFVNAFLPKLDTNNFYGYSGWNTSANTLGSLLASVKVKWQAKSCPLTPTLSCKEREQTLEAFKKLQAIRFLDDWAYQANVRGMIDKPCDISTLMKPYEEQISKALNFEFPSAIQYSYPWERKFEVEINL